MKRSIVSKSNGDAATGPVIPGSPLYLILNRVARAVAKRLLAKAEPADRNLQNKSLEK